MTWSDYLLQAIEPWLVRQWISDFVDDVLEDAATRLPETEVYTVKLPGRIHAITITGGFSR